jgi:hypothetical protein
VSDAESPADHSASGSPYRRGGRPAGGSPGHRDPAAEAPLLGLLLAFWAVSVVRVVGAIVAREAFGAEATLALLVAVGIPYAGWRVYRSSRAPSPSPGSAGSR